MGCAEYKINFHSKVRQRLVVGVCVSSQCGQRWRHFIPLICSVFCNEVNSKYLLLAGAVEMMPMCDTCCRAQPCGDMRGIWLLWALHASRTWNTKYPECWQRLQVLQENGNRVAQKMGPSSTAHVQTRPHISSKMKARSCNAYTGVYGRESDDSSHAWFTSVPWQDCPSWSRLGSQKKLFASAFDHFFLLFFTTSDCYRPLSSYFTLESSKYLIFEPMRHITKSATLIHLPAAQH
jgi:hypothetical protein